MHRDHTSNRTVHLALLALLAFALGCEDLELGVKSTTSGTGGSATGGGGSTPGTGGAATTATTSAGGSAATSTGGTTTGTGGEGGGPECIANTGVRCTGLHGNERQTCDATGQWDPSTSLCPSVCSGGDCFAPPSCAGAPKCGSNESCCASYRVDGGTFSRSYDAVGFTDSQYSATLSPFLLDRYEVTVGRFRNWVLAYDQSGAKPPNGVGANPSNGSDTGWDDTNWTSLLPADAAALKTALASCTSATWTDNITANDALPVNCVSWYVAQAFCIWDGGRLPTEAEWNFAAAGGDDHRVYPWSNPSTSPTIDSSHAVYNPDAIAPPGSKSTTGDGRFGHADQAGNLWEWVQDWHADPFPTTTCDDCATLTAGTDRVYRGGGYQSSSGFLVVSYRGDHGAPTSSSRSIGIRCARTP